MKTQFNKSGLCVLGYLRLLLTKALFETSFKSFKYNAKGKRIKLFNQIPLEGGGGLNRECVLRIIFLRITVKRVARVGAWTGTSKNPTKCL